MSRRLSNGRSPLVRKQSQITAFFSSPPSSSSTPKSKLSSTPSSDPSPSTSITNKPLLSIPPPSKTPSPPIKPKTPPSAETKPPKSDFIGRRIKVYWPLDKTWYTGRVKSYDVECNKYSIQYDDGEEESIEIEKEKVEWIEEEPPKKLRRLRKLSDKVEIEQEKSGSEECELDCVDDDSSDEDWGKNVEKESSEEVDLEEGEESEEVVAVKSRKERSTSSQSTGKRKKINVGKMGCAKKFKFEGDEEKGMPKATKGFAGVMVTLGIGSNNQSGALSQVLFKGGALFFVDDVA